MTMRHTITFGAAALALLPLTITLSAQTRVAPPTPVESTPLAPPPGASPVQAQPALPEPVQPPPQPQAPIVPQPVQPAPVPQVPLEPQPVQPPPALPAPTLPAPALPAPGVVPPPAAPQQQTGVPNANATLAGKPGDASDVDEVQLVAKPVLMTAGKATWDQGFELLSSSIKRLRDEAARAGLSVAGRPLALFLETDDAGFRFEAMLPVVTGSTAPVLGTGISLGASPAGRSLRFVHVAPYDDVDSTYETITAYLEAKNIVVKDLFIEEYVGDLNDPADANLEINVYVQPR